MMPNKIHWFLGYNNLALILEQERQHWLLKTDKKKQLQDKVTGDMFQGKIDNSGCDIVLETEQMPVKHEYMSLIAFQDESMNDILSVYDSAFTHSHEVNGLMFARVTSINYPYESATGIEYKNYKLQLNDCEVCLIPFASSEDSDEVFVSEWLRTKTPPTLLMLGDDGEYSIKAQIKFVSDVTNPVFYYPLTESIQPVNISGSDRTYVSDAINDSSMIGYPLYWFTCDQSNIGPEFTITNNTNGRGEQLFHIGNVGNAQSKHYAKLYTGIDGQLNATPDGTSTSNFVIRCKCVEGATFKNMDSDFRTAIDPTSITINTQTSNHSIGITCSDRTVITMSNDIPWVYVDESTYQIDMSVFDVNCFSVSRSPLVSIFDVLLDVSIPFTNSTNDIGFAGIRMSSANTKSDVGYGYPYNFNKWDGLPEHLMNLPEGSSPQHMVVYAAHNTPSYSENIPTSRQTAALLLDPGKPKTDMSQGFTNDECGRVYVISNDSTEYRNNATEIYPKPARTVARICDIPTSVMQMSGVTGLSPTNVVDKQYVRTEASFDLEDKERLYNTLANRWVKPTSLDKSGKPITDNESQDNGFVFNNPDLLELVDLINMNDFRYHTNLNPSVDPLNVNVASITSPGTGYVPGDIGVVVVGGFSFNYLVDTINEDGGVTKITLTPSSPDYVNLSNFDMTDGNSGISDIYGTSPLTGSGTGMKFRFLINNFDELLPKYGELFDDLFAFVKRSDGLWWYAYAINQESTSTPKLGQWTAVLRVTENENSSTNLMSGGIATPEAYINSIIPSIRKVMMTKTELNQSPVSVSTLSTPSFVNIIDKTKSPISNIETLINNTDVVSVDMCRFYCDGIIRLMSKYKTEQSVIDTLKLNGFLHQDSYVFWKWDNPSSEYDKYFTFGIIRRSFNNFLTTDSTTTIPMNELKYQKYVHSNQSTTVVWDVDHVGVMMWTYNPQYQKHEVYRVNPETMDLEVVRMGLNWDSIDIRNTQTGVPISLVDSETNRLLYNIITNNPIQARTIDATMINPEPIYQQPEFVQFDDLKAGTPLSSIIDFHKPMGNWQLVFPRVQKFKLTNIVDGQEFTPVKLQAIRGSNLGNVQDVVDEYGNNVNVKTVIINDTPNGSDMKIYNKENGVWESV